MVPAPLMAKTAAAEAACWCVGSTLMLCFGPGAGHPLTEGCQAALIDEALFPAPGSGDVTRLSTTSCVWPAGRGCAAPNKLMMSTGVGVWSTPAQNSVLLSKNVSSTIQQLGM